MDFSGWECQSRIFGIPQQGQAEELPGPQQRREQLRSGPLYGLHQELATSGHPDGPQPRGRDARQLQLLSGGHRAATGDLHSQLWRPQQ